MKLCLFFNFGALCDRWTTIKYSLEWRKTEKLWNWGVPIFLKSCILYSYQKRYLIIILIYRLKTYKKSKWSGTGSEICTNPKILLESIVTLDKPEKIIKEIKFSYYGTETKDKFEINDLTKILSYVDEPFYGRCYTIKPTSDMLSKGIKEIIIKYLDDMTILFHTPG